jgi:hypothetical protein
METNKRNNIIITLNNCASECTKCAIACLGEEDVSMMADCIKLDLDCSEICKTVASFASRSSVHAQHLMKECIEICKACASECEKHSHFEHCKKCAEVCRICIDECTSMQMAA